MNKTNTKLYYILLLFCFFFFFFLNEIIEFFTIHDTSDYYQQNNTKLNKYGSSTSSVVLPDIVSIDHIKNLSSNEEIVFKKTISFGDDKEVDLKKPISLRDDKEFQESLARMEELVEYSRNSNIPSETIFVTDLTELPVNNSRESYEFCDNTFERGLDPKLIDNKFRNIVHEDIVQEAEYFSNFSNYFDDDTTDINLNKKSNVEIEPSVFVNKVQEKVLEEEYFSNFSNYFDNNTSDININKKSNINNEPFVSINELSANISETDTDSDVISDTQIELDFNKLCDEDSNIDSDYSSDSSLGPISMVDYKSNSFTGLKNYIEPINLEGYQSKPLSYVSDSLPSQKDVSKSSYASSSSYNTKKQLFTNEESVLMKKLLNQTSDSLTDSGNTLPTFKKSYTNEELGLGNPYSSRSSYIPQRSNTGFLFPTQSSNFKTAGMASSMGRETNYDNSYLAKLDKDLQNIIGIKSDNTLEKDKEATKGGESYNNL